MMREEAIYARQSVDKKDSVSIETQIDQCKTSVSYTHLTLPTNSLV